MDLPNVSNTRRWLIVSLLFSASLINYLDRAAISLALPLISSDLHLLPASKNLLLSSFFWSYALMQIPVGWCADHLNLRWLYAGAFAIWSLAQGLTGLAGSLEVLIPHSAWDWRIHLSSGRYEDRLLAVQAGRSRAAVRTFRFRYSDRTGARRHSGPLASAALRVATHVCCIRIRRAGVDCALVVAFSSPLGATHNHFRLPTAARVILWRH